MKIIKHGLIGFVVLFLITCQAIAGQAVDEESMKSGENWLRLIDAEKYTESWNRASLTLKLTVSKAHWNALMHAVREPLGAVLSRKLLEQRLAKNPKGLPKGDYMILFFQTDFSKKKNAHELVTQVLESDGKWRVLTYQVQ